MPSCHTFPLSMRPYRSLILQHARKKIFVSNNTDKKNIVSDKCHKLSFYFRLDFTITNLTTGTSITASNNNTNSGWLVGAGIEWAFAPNWSAKVEYNYLGLDDRTFIVPAGVPGFLPGDTFTQSNRNIQMVKVGVNYLFNWSSYRY